MADEAAEALQEALYLDPVDARTPYMNLLGIALFRLGDYERAINAWEMNLEQGGPDGPHVAAMRAAAYVELGREEDARREIAALERGFAEFPPKQWINAWNSDPEISNRVLDNLGRIGWQQGIAGEM